MIRITPEDFKTVPWKNGKGITQLIISSGETDDYDWRFSRADVSNDGPFSIFEDKSRILTVIKGAGISLISSSSVIDAKPYSPVSFEGDIEINGKLWNGPIRDLNLIYSRKRVSASADLIQGDQELKLQPEHNLIFAVYCLNGSVNHDLGLPLHKGDFAIIKHSPCFLSLEGQNKLLLYSLTLK